MTIQRQKITFEDFLLALTNCETSKVYRYFLLSMNRSIYANINKIHDILLKVSTYWLGKIYIFLSNTMILG